MPRRSRSRRRMTAMRYASGLKLSKSQKKRREIARRQARVSQTLQDEKEEANPLQPTINFSTYPVAEMPVARTIFDPPCSPHMLSTPISSDAQLPTSNFSNTADRLSSNELIVPIKARQVISTSDSGACQSPLSIGRVLRGAEMREVAEELGRCREFVCRFVSRGVMCCAPPKYFHWAPEERQLRDAQTHTLSCVEHGNSLPRDRKYFQIPQSLSTTHSRKLPIQ
ncbi:hypothetical protein EI94DRAFT_815629 [Lactarius quietus]|nr:hypothetical protein EI94DRAFT_815629 [Lactarius quietus]